MNPTVSVIIPALDSARQLERCVASLHRGQGVDVETVVVDQSSRDETARIARDAGAKVLTLSRPRVYTPPTQSRNAGARVARGRYLLHLDADMELPGGVLAECVATCEKGGYVALTLHEIDRGEGFWTECKALERRCYWGVEHVEGARFVRSDVFWAVGGYDEALGSGEDWDIHRRYLAQGPVGESPVPIIHHLGHLTLSGQLKKKFAYGRTARAFVKKGGADRVAVAMTRAYWRSRRRLARDPLHAAGLLFLRSVEAVALAVGMAVEAQSSSTRRTPGPLRTKVD